MLRSFHYYRIHPAYWRDRLLRAQAMGLNTIQAGASMTRAVALSIFRSPLYDTCLSFMHPEDVLLVTLRTSLGPGNSACMLTMMVGPQCG